MLLFTKVLMRMHATAAYVFANQYMIALIDITRHIWDSAIHSPYAKCQIPEAFCTLDMCYESNIFFGGEDISVGQRDHSGL